MQKRLTKKVFTILALGLLFNSFAFAQVEITTAEDAILYAEALVDNGEKVTYLMDHANKFVEQKKYAEARTIVDHILEKLNPELQEAKDLQTTINLNINEETMPEVNPVEIKF